MANVAKEAASAQAMVEVRRAMGVSLHILHMNVSLVSPIKTSRQPVSCSLADQVDPRAAADSRVPNTQRGIANNFTSI